MCYKPGNWLLLRRPHISAEEWLWTSRCNPESHKYIQSYKGLHLQNSPGQPRYSQQRVISEPCRGFLSIPVLFQSLGSQMWLHAFPHVWILHCSTQAGHSPSAHKHVKLPAFVKRSQDLMREQHIMLNELLHTAMRILIDLGWPNSAP